MEAGSGLILSCSPRRGGNCDSAARLLAEELHQCGFHYGVERLTDHKLRPCTACGYCDRHAGSCALDGEGDEAGALLGRLSHASPLCCSILVSPVYFYHLPAQLKALMDRSQRWWNAEETSRPALGTALAPVLVAARPRGDKLFAGAMLSLKYMALTMGFELLPPLLLYGLDDARAFLRSGEARSAVEGYARALAERGSL